MMKSEGGTFTEKSPVDGVERLFSFRRVPGFPVIAYTGLAREDSFAGLRDFTMYRIASPALTIFAVILLGMVLRKFIVTQRQAQDAELQRISDQRRTEFLESVMRMSGAYVVVIESSGRIRTSNEAFRQRFTDDSDLVPVLSNLSGRTWVAGKEATSLSLNLADLPKSFETILKPGNSGERFIDWTFSIFSQTDTGVVECVIGIGLDTTDRRRAQSEVYQSAKLATLGQMATGLAHEINQPLAALGTYLAVLRARLAGPDDRPASPASEIVLRAEEQLSRCSAIMQKFREFGGVEGFKPASVRLCDLVDDAVALSLVRERDPGLRLSVVHSEEPIVVVVDTTQLKLVIINLLQNAVDASVARPGRHVEIETVR